MLEPQVRQLGDTDAVLAAERPIEFDGVAEELSDGAIDAWPFLGLISEIVDVQVAVPGVTVREPPHVFLLGIALDAFE